MKPKDRVGKLVVQDQNELREYYSGGRRRFWLCKCDCGNEIWAVVGKLKSGKIWSCGCGPVEKCTESLVRHLFYLYHHKASIRNLSFELTKEQFRHLTKQDCHYCGKQPSNIYKRGQKGRYVYSGIDRKDSSQGYSVENCVPCCGNCNRAKMDMPYGEFLDLIRRIFYFRCNQEEVNCNL